VDKPHHIFQELRSSVSEWLLAGATAVLTELHIVRGGEGAGRWGGCSVVSNSNIGHLSSSCTIWGNQTTSKLVRLHRGQ